MIILLLTMHELIPIVTCSYTSVVIATYVMGLFEWSYSNVIIMHAIMLIYCILCGRIKRFNRSITTILFEVGSYRIVVG